MAWKDQGFPKIHKNQNNLLSSHPYLFRITEIFVKPVLFLVIHTIIHGYLLHQKSKLLYIFSRLILFFFARLKNAIYKIDKSEKIGKKTQCAGEVFTQIKSCNGQTAFFHYYDVKQV